MDYYELDTILSKGIAKREEILDKMIAFHSTSSKEFLTLLEQSELRIQKTNEMVDKLVTLMFNLTAEYSKHLDQLSNSRDEVVKQNSYLIKEIEEFKKEMSEAQQRYDLLVQKLFDMLRSRTTNENHIKLDRV